MKKRNIILILPLSLLFSGTPAKRQATPSFDGKFYDSAQKLDLSDATASEIDAYYGDIGDKTGNDLKDYLYAKISCPTGELSKYYLDYGSGINKKNVGGWYQITDRNWLISDAVDPDTFRFKTKRSDAGVSGIYLYNMYISDEANNDRKKAFSNFANGTGWTTGSAYKSIDYANNTKPNKNIQVDKEHVWAKNHGFKVKGSGGDTFVPGAPTDLHHLVAADHNTNSAGHNDHFYGKVKKHDSTTEIKNYLADGTMEVSGWLDAASDTFEPTDEWKGDIARCLLYMATRYSQKKDTNSQAEPYLYLTDDTNYKDDDALVGSGEKKFHGVQYHLTDLLAWNESDPVSPYEKHRNNLIYKNVQNNRNPYIDHPEWARRVYDVTYHAESDFTALKDCDAYTDIDYPLGITIADRSKVKAEYDKSIITLSENMTSFKALKAGETTLTFTEATDKGEKTYTSHIQVKAFPTLTQILPSYTSTDSLKLTTGTEQELHLPTDLYAGDRISITSSDPEKVAVEDNKLVAKGIGTATISIQITGNGKKLLVGAFNVVVQPPKKLLYIAIIVVAAVLLILFFLVLGIIIHKQNSKKRVDYSSKKTYQKATRKKRTGKKK